MPRSPRTVMEGYELIEVSNRTVHSRFLLKPCPELNDIVHGAIAKAQSKYGVKVHAYVFLSNHYHLLISPCDSLRMARFVGYFQAKISKEVGRLYGWKDKVWARRFCHIPVASDEASQVARLRYLLANGCKEDLVYSPLAWPGASSTEALTTGRMRVSGVWPDRTAVWRAPQGSEALSTSLFLLPETVELSPLPCWSHLSLEAHRDRVREIVVELERETRARHQQNRTRPLGVRRICSRPSHGLPLKTKRSAKPVVHAATRQARRDFLRAFRQFVGGYRRAVERLRKGDLGVRFPPGTFPPGLPFRPT